jgi:hypothetical protein
MNARPDQNILATVARAVELTEAALGEIARVAIEQIHGDLDSSTHVDAAERDMRSALRQLVLAERELRSSSEARTGPDDRAEGIAEVMPAEAVPAEVVPGPGSGAVQTGA